MPWLKLPICNLSRMTVTLKLIRKDSFVENFILNKKKKEIEGFFVS